MTTTWIVYVCLAAGLSSALVAGVFQAFSDFVMKALIAAEPTSGIEAMQMINRTVLRSFFVVLLLGLAPGSLALAAYAYLYLGGPAAAWIQTGTAIYVIGVFLVTLVGNVPMNNRLARLEHTADETVGYWRIYGVSWTRWNHVRTFCSLWAAICFLIAALALA